MVIYRHSLKITEPAATPSLKAPEQSGALVFMGLVSSERATTTPSG